MKTLIQLLLISCIAGAPSLVASPLNTLTAEEKKEGWQLLWDGQTSAGWRSARNMNFPATGWKMQEGILTVIASDGSEGGRGGDIITVDKFGDFELALEFRITPGANSGIKYFVDPQLNPNAGSAIGLEYQILDDQLHPDAKQGRDGNRTLASLYDLIPAAQNKPARPVGGWNSAYILSRGGHVEHWLNGVKVVDYERFTAAFRQLVQSSKYKRWPNFGELKEGHILLQDHGDTVSFRNIKIRVLSEQKAN